MALLIFHCLRTPWHLIQSIFLSCVLIWFAYSPLHSNAYILDSVRYYLHFLTLWGSFDNWLVGIRLIGFALAKNALPAGYVNTTKDNLLNLILHHLAIKLEIPLFSGTNLRWWFTKQPEQLSTVNWQPRGNSLQQSQSYNYSYQGRLNQSCHLGILIKTQGEKN